MQPPSGRGHEEHLGHLLAVAFHLSTTCPQIYPGLLTYPQGQDAHPFPLGQPFPWSGYIGPGLLYKAWLLGLVSFLHPGSLSFPLSRARLGHNGSGVVRTHPGQRMERDKQPLFQLQMVKLR